MAALYQKNIYISMVVAVIIISGKITKILTIGIGHCLPLTKAERRAQATLVREKYNSRPEWLKARHYGIGASDAAALLGKSPWKSNLQLWLEKTSEPIDHDSVKNAAVELGINLEAPIREIFKVKHPEFTVDYFPYDILYHKDKPWIRATLDGEITEIATGKKGIYEGKTATCIKRIDWGRWSQGIPEHYLIQIIWQLAATGYDFVFLCAFLINKEGDRCEYREYRLDREDCEEDIEYMKKVGDEFWTSVLTHEMPPMILGSF